MSLREPLSKQGAFALTLLGFLTLFILWSALTYGGVVRPIFLPSPTAVYNGTISLFVEHQFHQDIVASVYRVFAGFFLGALLAIPLGISIGVSKRVSALIEPIVSFIRYMPAAAFIPLAILWLGIGDVEKMFIIFIGTFPYLTLMVVDVVLNVPKEYLDVARSFGATKWTMLEKIIIPASLPGIWDSLRVMAGIGWTYIIVAELVAARSGIGHVIIEAQRYLLTSNIITGLIVIGLLGVITDQVFMRMYSKFFPYTVKSQST